MRRVQVTPSTKTVTFHNVTVTIAGADDAVEAYDLLCTALATLESDTIDVEWETDTYSTCDHQDGSKQPSHPTRELFPESRRRDR